MVYAFGGASAAAAASASRSCAEPLALWPRNNRVAANSPSLCPTMFSVMHNGNKFIPVYITENMVGHKLGEFAATRLFRGHSAKGSAQEREAEAAAAAEAPKA